MNTDSQYLQSVLHSDIPLTREMGLEVIDWQQHTLRLQLPLAANVNHKSTMFGGSLYCAAVLAGWGWLHLRLRALGIDDGHIVIQEGRSVIRCRLPVRRWRVVHRPTKRPGSDSWPCTSAVGGRG